MATSIELEEFHHMYSILFNNIAIRPTSSIALAACIIRTVEGDRGIHDSITLLPIRERLIRNRHTDRTILPQFVSKHDC